MCQETAFKDELTSSLNQFFDFIKHLPECDHIKNGHKKQTTLYLKSWTQYRKWMMFQASLKPKPPKN